jgi:hypothetical protein
MSPTTASLDRQVVSTQVGTNDSDSDATNRAGRLPAHHIVAGPAQRHSLLTETDPVVLLTVRLDE